MSKQESTDRQFALQVVRASDFEPATVPTNGRGRHLVTCEAVTRRSAGGPNASRRISQYHGKVEGLPILSTVERQQEPAIPLSAYRVRFRSLHGPAITDIEHCVRGRSALGIRSRRDLTNRPEHLGPVLARLRSLARPDKPVLTRRPLQMVASALTPEAGLEVLLPFCRS